MQWKFNLIGSGEVSRGGEMKYNIQNLTICLVSKLIIRISYLHYYISSSKEVVGPTIYQSTEAKPVCIHRFLKLPNSPTGFPQNACMRTYYIFHINNIHLYHIPMPHHIYPTTINPNNIY